MTSRKKLSAILLVGGVACLLFWLHLRLTGPHPSPYSDTWDYAHLSRNISRGMFMQSDFTYPIVLSVDPEYPFQSFWRLPIYPLVGAMLFLFHPSPPVEWMILLSGFFYVVGAMLLTVIIQRNTKVSLAILGGVLFLGNTMIIHQALEGMAEPLYILLLLGVYVSLAMRTRSGDFVAGILFGISWLTKSNSIFLLPALVVWFAFAGKGWKSKVTSLAWSVGGIVLVSLPWWLSNHLASNKAFFNMSRYAVLIYSEEYPGWSLFRTVMPLEEMKEMSLVHLVKEMKFHWEFFAIDRIKRCNPVIYLCAVPEFVFSFRQRKEKPFRWHRNLCILLADFSLAFGLAMVNPSVRLYCPILPFIIIMGVNGITRIPQISWFPYTWRKSTQYLTVGLLLFSVLAIDSRYIIKTLRSEEAFVLSTEDIGRLEAMLPKEEVILSDTTDYISWALDRPSILLPTLESIRKLTDMQIKISSVHLSPTFEKFMSFEGDDGERWIQLREGEPPLGRLLLKTENGHRFYEFKPE